MSFRGIFVGLREYLNLSSISFDTEYLELLGINIVVYIAFLGIVLHLVELSKLLWVNFNNGVCGFK